MDQQDPVGGQDNDSRALALGLKGGGDHLGVILAPLFNPTKFSFGVKSGTASPHSSPFT
jgi:hypothetical protein